MAEPITEGPRAFARFIESVADGVAHQKISKKFHELMQSLEKEASARGIASGDFDVHFHIVLQENGQADVTYKSKSKEPEEKHGKGIFWLTPGGNPTFENPRQQKLQLRDVTSSGAQLAKEEERGPRAVADV